jgi:hypothetical protein
LAKKAKVFYLKSIRIANLTSSKFALREY